MELYDLCVDPCELSDLGMDTRHEQVRRELDKRLLGWLKDGNDPILHGPVRTPTYRMATAGLTSDKPQEWSCMTAARTSGCTRFKTAALY